MLTEAAYQSLAGFLKSRSGLSLSTDKVYLLETRLQPLLRQHGLRDLAALTTLVCEGAEPLGSAVVEAMATHESFFFREPRAFSHLTDQVLPRLRKTRPSGSRLRIWSAACSTGQEPYTVAMLLADRPGGTGRDVEIIGTDISKSALARASEGLFSSFEIHRGLPDGALSRYFRQEGEGWRIDARLRQSVQFRPWNLLTDPAPLGRFDVVFCRNVLIYFDQSTKARVLESIAACLAPDGVLYLGGTETVLGLTTKLVPVPDAPGVCAYQRAAVSRRNEPRNAIRSG